MALDWRDRNGRGVGVRDGLSRPSDAFMRGAARRRGEPGWRSREPAQTHPSETKPKASLPAPAPERDESPAATIVLVDPAWRSEIETRLAAVQDAIARLDADHVTESQALRDTVERVSTTTKASDGWADQVELLQARVQRVEHAIAKHGERVTHTDSDASPGTERAEPVRDQAEALGRAVVELREQQETLAATLAVVAERLTAERIRTTAVILAGTAVTLLFTTLWLLTNTLLP